MAYWLGLRTECNGHFVIYWLGLIKNHIGWLECSGSQLGLGTQLLVGPGNLEILEDDVGETICNDILV
jgi:hypothetical protein